MRVRIRIRAGVQTPIKGQVFECIVEEIGQESLTVIPITDHIRGTAKREFRLQFTDIEQIAKPDREPNEYVVYLVTTSVLCLIILYVGFSQIQLD